MQLILSHTRLLRAMGQNGFRRPGNMIAKLVDDEVKKIAKKARYQSRKNETKFTCRRQKTS